MSEMYPKLRRNDYRIIYKVRNFNLEEARALIDSNPRKLSLGEMYIVAGSYEKNSKEYNHVIEVAAKTYPTQLSAAVNGAVVMVGNGDVNGALAALSQVDQNNTAVMVATAYAYAVGGDSEKAHQLWKKAEAQGSEEATHNLEELAKTL